MTHQKTEISVVIPVYRSQDCLSELVRRLTDVLETSAKTYEIILVDDNSPDDSWDIIQVLVSQYSRLRSIRLMRNTGQAAATLCGLENTAGEIVVTMDDDLQHRPDQLPKMLATFERCPEIDCVFGAYRKKQHGLLQNVASSFILWINAKAFGLPREFRSTSYRMMRKSLVDAIVAHRTQNAALPALILASTDLEHADRFAGKTGYTLSKQLRLALDNICNVSMLPLRAASAMGIGICFLSVLMVIYVLFKYFTGGITVQGWATVVILVCFFSGLTLLSLGVIGEYMVRILREVRGAPRFVVRERLGFGNGKSQHDIP